MKKILCFGDSNIYGFNPLNGSRYAKKERWSGILQELAKDKFNVIEAGCNNRTAFSPNPAGKMMTGIEILPELLTSDLDIVILAIGINDLQLSYNTSLDDYKRGLPKLINIVKDKSPASEILLVAPSKITPNILNSFFANLFDKTSIEKSSQLGEIYKQIAFNNNCKFLNLDDLVKPSSVDGLHYEIQEHNKIAQSIYKIVEEINLSNF